MITDEEFIQLLAVATFEDDDLHVMMEKEDENVNVDVDLDAVDSGINVKMELEMDGHQLSTCSDSDLEPEQFLNEDFTE